MASLLHFCYTTFKVEASYNLSANVMVWRIFIDNISLNHITRELV